jgi:tRNA threonylcarbamoyladenosine biosynthesis protein TsaB
VKLLAIDTSSDACSVALRVDENLVDEHVVGEREHTSILVPMIERLLREGEIAMPELDAVVLGNGPGSFIGMRIGASVAQGICYGAGLKLVPISSLVAVAAETIDRHDAEHILVAQDARMHEVYLGRYRRDHEVYLGRYRRDGDGLPVATSDEEIHAIGVIDGLAEQYVAAGAAWEKFPKLLQDNRGRISEVAPIRLPRAAYLLDSGARMVREGGSIPPNALLPSYIRVKVAEKRR